MTEPQLIHTTYKVSRELPAMLLLPAGKPPLGGWPLVLALHGMGESCDLFAEQLQPAISVGGRAWLIPSGPLALERRREPGIGYAWYIFGGDQERLKQSTAAAAGELGGLLASVAAEHPVNPGLASVVGFSQGGYLASVLWTHIAGLRAICCIGGRLKQEWWPEVPSRRPGVLAVARGGRSVRASRISGQSSGGRICPWVHSRDATV